MMMFFIISIRGWSIMVTKISALSQHGQANRKMTEIIIVDGRQQKIEVYVAVIEKLSKTVVAEYDNMREANKHWGEYLYDKKWAAAEWIDEDGNVNPATYADSKRAVISKLKKVL